jgi:murein DD-endopeptidase MepM/ murein hydrolase activator NlpD
MCVWRRSAVWPRVVAISLIGFGAAGCSNDSGRFSDIFGSDTPSRGEVTGSIPQGAPASRVESRPMPHLADGQGVSGGGRGMGSYQPGSGEITGSLPPAPPPPPTWTWEGGTPITVAPGETLEMIARRYGMPVAAIMEANNITSPAMVHPGMHLVIPRYRSSAAALATPPATRIASTARTIPTVPAEAPRAVLAPTSGVHIVAPGETLHSIARLYGKPVLALAKANNISPDTMVRVGDRIVVPDMKVPQRPAPVPLRAETPVRVPAGPDLATAESPHSARLATTAAPPAQENSVKTAEPAGQLPGFRWPVRGRVIAGFGPKPNGLQNDGINLAVPEGTPIKAAEDGVVAYAGNELKGYGNLVLVRHGNGYVTAYAHASEILVKRGDQVKRGQVIAHSGQTGNVTSPQLHFEIRKGANPIDPMPMLSGG